MITREELLKLPERTEIFRHGYGASVEMGVFSCWEDASIERDIYNVSAYKLMEALNVDTLDELFKVIKDRFCFDSIKEFLDEKNIGYAGYAF